MRKQKLFLYPACSGLPRLGRCRRNRLLVRSPGVTACMLGLRGPLTGVTLQAELACCLPTPVRRLDVAGAGECLWLKDDGLTGVSYGGNKLRKLAPIIADALAGGKQRIVTVGAAGSHHVVATTLYAAREGLRTTALLFPQLGTPHVQDNLRAAIACGLEVVPVASPREVFAFMTRLQRSREAWAAPGAMGTRGASGFADAVAELAGQIGRGECPEPDGIILPVGSGSSAAGLLVGIVEQRLKTRLIGVSASTNPAVRPMVLGQAWSLFKRRSLPGGTRRTFRQLSARLQMEAAYVGGGYGVPTPLSYHALRVARAHGLALEHTYTAKAFAAALAMASRHQEQHLMFWNTVSSAPLDSMLLDAPLLAELPKRVRDLLQPMNLDV